MQSRECLDFEPVNTALIQPRFGHIDSTVLRVARPDDNDAEEVVYNGQKRVHGLKFQDVCAPDGLFIHCYGLLEGRRHDWILYKRFGLDADLNDVLQFKGREFCVNI